MEWYRLSTEEVVEKLKTDIDAGLTPEEAKLRQVKWGKNAFSKVPQTSGWQLLFNQTKSPLAYILIIAGFITLYLREYPDTIVIFLVVAINIAIGFFQENRSSQAFAKLKSSIQFKTTLLRARERQMVPVEEVVVGDVIVLQPGDAIPADARIIHQKDLHTNEASLTGEWVSVPKSAGIIDKERLRITDQANMAFMGSLVSSGSALAVVVATGDATEIGKIAKTLTSQDGPETNFQKSVKKIAHFLSAVVVLVVVVIFFLGLARGEPLEQMILTSLAVAVAAIPSGLPIAVTVVLAIGLEQILRRGALVKNLSSAETLGVATVILTDKTGTLTEAKMEVGFITGCLKGQERAVLEQAVLASNAFVEYGESELAEWKFQGTPVEVAILRAAVELGINPDDLGRRNARVDYLAFESQRRYSASLNHNLNDGHCLYLAGAPETIIQAAALPPKRKEELLQEYNRRAAAGTRFVAVASRPVPWEQFKRGDNIIEGVHFTGLIGLHDPLRSDVPATIREAKQAGIRIIMATGDHAETARQVARSAGIIDGGLNRVVSGEHFSFNKEVNVFARMLPDQKLQLLKSLQREGEIVAMTGDGVNDSPALINADIGIALGSGTDVAREAADMILLDNSFSVIVYAIEEGRRILDNLKKIVTYLLSTSLSEVLVVGSAFLLGAPLPILPVQIFWSKIIEESFMNFAFAFEPASQETLSRSPRHPDSRHILTPNIKKLIVCASLVTGLLAVGIFLILLKLGLPIEKVRTLIFAIVSVDSIFFTFSLKDFKKRLWQINFFNNRYLIFAFLTSVAGLLLALFVPPFNTLLHIAPLTGWDILLILGVGLLNLSTVEVLKFLVFKPKMIK